MKRIFILAALLLLSISALAQNGRSIYQKYSEADDVSAVYISPAMFRLIGRLPDLEVGRDKVNVAPIIQSLTGMYLLSSENPRINDSLRADVERYIASGEYEMLMEVKDAGETVRMYTLGDEKTVSGFVMLAAEAAEVTFICLDGRMSRQAFEDLLSRQMGD